METFSMSSFSLWMWNWKSTISYTALAGIIFFVGTKYIRYGSGREFILNVFCTIQGRKYKWVREPNLARRLLMSSTSKGIGIEQILSLIAFRPIVSLESVNDEQWARMKEHFMILKTHLPSLDSLETIAEDITKEFMEEYEVIDCRTLAKLVVQIMETWLFGRVAKEDEDSQMLLVSSIEEYRKELAIKEAGNRTLKEYATHWIQNKIRNHRKYYEIFEEKWFTDEYWSLLLQPFIVSPVINITDIAVTLASTEFREEFLSKLLENRTGTLKKSDMEQIILHGINYNHPFPVLERWFPNGLLKDDGDEKEFIIEPNTHVFIPIDEIGRGCCKSSASTIGNSLHWTAFGAGKRACGGMQIAMTLCSNMFYHLLTDPKGLEKFKPSISHNYSGRDNDLKETWSQTYFQTKLLIQILFKLIVYQKV